MISLKAPHSLAPDWFISDEPSCEDSSLLKCLHIQGKQVVGKSMLTEEVKEYSAVLSSSWFHFTPNIVFFVFNLNVQILKNTYPVNRRSMYLLLTSLLFRVCKVDGSRCNVHILL